jgi:hypothetical protein
VKREVLIVTAFLMILLPNLGCKKKQVVTEYIPNELKEYALFQPGSFWIYRNEITGGTDSTYISNKPEFTYHSEGYDDYTIPEICHLLYDGSFFISTQLEPHRYYIFINRYEFEAIQPTSFVPNQIINLYGGATLRYFPLIDSMTINNNTFHDVFVTQHQFISLTSDTFTNTSYFVKKIGLIKFNRKIANADTTWHILNYHAIQ